MTTIINNFIAFYNYIINNTIGILCNECIENNKIDYNKIEEGTINNETIKEDNNKTIKEDYNNKTIKEDYNTETSEENEDTETNEENNNSSYYDSIYYDEDDLYSKNNNICNLDEKYNYYTGEKYNYYTDEDYFIEEDDLYTEEDNLYEEEDDSYTEKTIEDIDHEEQCNCNLCYTYRNVLCIATRRIKSKKM